MLTNEESREIGGGLKFCHARVITPLLPPPLRVFKRAKKLRLSSLPRSRLPKSITYFRKEPNSGSLGW